jgi:PEP-CTERM motif
MKQLSMLCAAALVLFTGATASAQISATLWSVPFATANDVPTAGNVPGPGAVEWATFNATGFNFVENGGNFDINTFINSGGGISNLTYLNGVNPNANGSLDNVLIQFTGTALFTNGQSFTVTHDDGVQMYVDGVNLLSDPSSTSATTTPFTYTGTTGDFSFDFIYANSFCCGSDFVTTLVTSTTVVGTTPEPSSIALLGTGMLTVAGVVRRRMRKS